jgi:hypothetical protein
MVPDHIGSYHESRMKVSILVKAKSELNWGARRGNGLLRTTAVGFANVPRNGRGVMASVFKAPKRSPKVAGRPHHKAGVPQGSTPLRPLIEPYAEVRVKRCKNGICSGLHTGIMRPSA